MLQAAIKPEVFAEDPPGRQGGQLQHETKMEYPDAANSWVGWGGEAVVVFSRPPLREKTTASPPVVTLTPSRCREKLQLPPHCCSRLTPFGLLSPPTAILLFHSSPW